MRNLALILAGFLLFSITGTLLAADSVEVKGRIYDARNVPVAGAEVYAYRSANVRKPADFKSTLSAADGTYRLILPPGAYFMVAVQRVHPKSFGPLEEGDRHSGDPLEVEVARSRNGLDFQILNLREAALKGGKRNEELLEISGRLLDKDGAEVPGAYAIAAKAPRFKGIPPYFSAWSDASGGYHLFIPKGRYYLGGALVFPPNPAYVLEKEIVVEKDQNDLDIVVEGN